jgi:hypothetical protein
MLKFARRTATGTGRALFPLVAVAVAARSAAACAGKWRDDHRSRMAGGVG